MLFRRNISKLTDSELLNKFRRTGENEYFGELYNRYIPLLYGVCLKYLQQAEEAQDAVMQIYEELLPKISRHEIGEFRTWVYSVARNHCLQILRKNQREILTDFTTFIMESDDVLHLLDEGVHDDERIEKLNRCLEKLPENQRISIIQFFMEDLSYQDIVDKTGFELKRVKSYIQNGKRNLGICIEKHSE